MNKALLRNTIISSATHLLLICVLLGYSLISCRSHRAPRELIVFADFQPAAAATPAAAPDPAPVEKPIPTPPAPQSRPKAQKPKIEVNTNIVRRAETTRPKPQQKKLSAEEIRRMLNASVAQPASSGAQGHGADGGETTPYGWYLNQVRAIMYEAWEQPSASAVQRGSVAQVMLRVQQNGLIMQRKLLKPSGNAAMDRSVMAAVEKIERLPELPFGFGGAQKDITIDFELEQIAP